MEHEPTSSSAYFTFHRRNARLSVNSISIICLKNVELFAQAKSRLTQSARIIAFNSQTNIAHYGYFALKFRHRCVYKILRWDAYTDIERRIRGAIRFFYLEDPKVFEALSNSLCVKQCEISKQQLVENFLPLQLCLSLFQRQGKHGRVSTQQ